ncbi:MAG: 1-deoxy-D-xylulose-5-phosphate reductoisomerase, partial [Candidatus Aminicenantes bacterium]|nr:1-deoxy-D-xylulose-5-phosphate reductoisomerase [Candidatus Aminicenantes bacterium]
MKNIAVLGSTGSIGLNTLKVVDSLSEKFKIVGLAAGRNLDLLKQQILKYRPDVVSVERAEDAQELIEALGKKTPRIYYGQEGAEEVSKYAKNDIVVSAITGINGLRPTLAAVGSGKRIAIANKEAMVTAGHLVRKTAAESGAEIIPIDSEHSGIFQCLAKEDIRNVKKVILTASGGPFFNSTLEEMKEKTPEEALNHPRWEMGKKVSIDSASFMNKGLELIEAKWLFDLEPEQLDILVHPQSVVHSLIELHDGSILAQLSQTDMKIPIQYALTYPAREDGLLPSLDLGEIKALEFYKVDTDKFSLIKLARQALKEGGSFSV